MNIYQLIIIGLGLFGSGTLLGIGICMIKYSKFYGSSWHPTIIPPKGELNVK